MTKNVFKTNQIITGMISIIAGLVFAYFFRREIFLLFQSSSEKSIYYIFLIWPALFILGGIFGILSFVSDKTVLSVLQVAFNFFAFYWVDKAALDDRYWPLVRTLVSGVLACETIFFLLGYDLSVRANKKELAGEIKGSDMSCLDVSAKIKSIIMTTIVVSPFVAIWLVGARNMTGRVLYDKISIGWFCFYCFVVIDCTITVAFCLDLKRKEPIHFIWPGMRLGLGVALSLGSFILVFLALYESTYLLTGDMTMRDVLWVSLSWVVMGMILLAARKSSSYLGYLIVMILCIFSVVDAYEIINNIYWKIGCIAFPVAVFLFLCCFIMFPVLKKIAEKRKTS